MQNKLIIKNFGPIKNVNIKLKPFIVLIDESEDSKSIIMKTMMLFRFLYLKINSCSTTLLLTSKDLQKDFNKIIDDIDISKTIKIMELHKYITSNSELICTMYGFEMKICIDNNTPIVKFSDSFNLNQLCLEEVSYIPKYRLAFDVINRVQHIEDQSYYFKSFYKMLNSSCDFLSESNFDNNSIINTIIHNSLNNDIFKTDDLDEFNKQISKSCTFFIEELELGTHPNKQVHLIDDIVTAFNNTIFNMNVVFSTNSPYVLSHLNCLLYAHSVSKRKIDCTNIVPKDHFLDINTFIAYNIIDGKSKSLINKKTNLILADEIDKVSEKIGEIFDSLLDL